MLPSDVLSATQLPSFRALDSDTSEEPCDFLRFESKRKTNILEDIQCRETFLVSNVRDMPARDLPDKVSAKMAGEGKEKGREGGKESPLRKFNAEWGGSLETVGRYWQRGVHAGIPDDKILG